MRLKAIALASALAFGCSFGSLLYAQGPTIPPSIASIWPAGMERGATAAFKIEGRNLTDAEEVIFDAPGMSAKVTGLTGIPEQITGPRAGQDLGAQVPLGKKQSAELEITIAPDAEPGIHRFRVKTPLGTTNTVAIAVGTLPEIKQPEKSRLPATGIRIGSRARQAKRLSFKCRPRR